MFSYELISYVTLGINFHHILLFNVMKIYGRMIVADILRAIDINHIRSNLNFLSIRFIKKYK